jgi:hypothetical protein
LAQRETLQDEELVTIANAFNEVQAAAGESLFGLLRQRFQDLIALLALLYRGIDWFDRPLGELEHHLTEADPHRYGEERVSQWVYDAIGSCEAHVSQHTAPGDVAVSVCPQGSGSLITVYLIDPRPEIGTLVWDEHYIPDRDPVADALFLTLTGYVVGYHIREQREWRPGPLFTYHPERFRQTRDYLKPLTQVFRERGLNDRPMTLEIMEQSSQFIVEALNEQQAKYPLRARIADNAPMGQLIHREVERFMLHHAFIACGRRIFDVSGTLAEMFRHTSVDEVPVSDLASPFETYYVHVGPHHDLSPTDGWVIDGAYVQHLPDSQLIQFLFTTAPQEPTWSRDWAGHDEPSYTLAISGERYACLLGEAVTATIEERRRELRAKIAKGDRDLTEEMRHLADEEGIQLPAERITEPAATQGALQLQALEAEIPVLSEALMLIINAMCYLTAYPDDIERDWAPTTPRHMVAKASKGNASVKKRTQSKLESLGYRRIYIGGRSLHQGPAVDGPTAKKRTHWRRGHWKRQPYGPGKALRKLVLIKPTLVNPGEGHDAPPGGIYIGENVVDFKDQKRRRRG